MNAIYTSAKYSRFAFAFGLVFSTLFVGCSNVVQGRSSSEDWIELTTVVDGVLEIHVQAPRPANDRWTSRTQFMGSEADKIIRIFDLGYDPGRGNLSGAMMVYFYGAVVRIEKEGADDKPVNFYDFISLVYSSNPEKKSDYQIVGEEIIGNDEWFKVKFVSQQPLEGYAYYRTIFDNYGLLISMNMFGKNSDKTSLYQQRYQDFLRVLGSVKVTVADFADQND